jgi:hypothetical protein
VGALGRSGPALLRPCPTDATGAHAGGAEVGRTDARRALSVRRLRLAPPSGRRLVSLARRAAVPHPDAARNAPRDGRAPAREREVSTAVLTGDRVGGHGTPRSGRPSGSGAIPVATLAREGPGILAWAVRGAPVAHAARQDGPSSLHGPQGANLRRRHPKRSRAVDDIREAKRLEQFAPDPTKPMEKLP